MTFNERLLICGVKTTFISVSDIIDLSKKDISLTDQDYFPPTLFRSLLIGDQKKDQM